MNTTLLESQFTGIGEVKGKNFSRVYDSGSRYIYEVTEEGSPKPYYEVFDRKTTPLCVDFANRIYSESDFKEIYPKAKDFGVWAWTFKNIETAKNKADEHTKD